MLAHKQKSINYIYFKNEHFSSLQMNTLVVYK